MSLQQRSVRWMRPMDVGEVVDIDQAVSDDPLDVKDYLKLCKRKGVVLVAEYDDRIVGFLAYELHKRWAEVLRVGVHPTWRRCGFGRALLAEVTPPKLNKTYTAFNVGDEWLPNAHQWLVACGWRLGGYIRERDGYIARFESTTEEPVLA
jgi:GNAT superfamily N-acetyltransferase